MKRFIFFHFHFANGELEKKKNWKRKEWRTFSKLLFPVALFVAPKPPPGRKVRNDCGNCHHYLDSYLN